MRMSMTRFTALVSMLAMLCLPGNVDGASVGGNSAAVPQRVASGSSGEVRATATEIRDPWGGFKKKSWVITREVFSGDGVTNTVRRRCTVSGIDSEGSVWLSTSDEKNGQFPAPTLSGNISGLLPSDVGFVLVKEAKDKLTIGDKDYPVSVSVWLKPAKEEKTISPESRESKILKKRDLHVSTDRPLELVLYRTEGVNIPYRAVTMQGASIALGPDIVKAECTVRRTRRGRQYEHKVVHEIKNLNEKVTVGANTVSCVLESVRMYDVGDTVESNEVSGTMWLSNEVPGREVKREGFSADGSWRVTMVVEDFEVK